MVLTFRQVDYENLIKGKKYKIYVNNSDFKVYICTFNGYFDGYPKISTWINGSYIFINPYTREVTTGNVLSLTFHKAKYRILYELIRSDAQYSMEKRAVNIILRQLLDESFVYE